MAAQSVGKWLCPGCEILNPDAKSICGSCEKPNPAKATEAAAKPKPAAYGFGLASASGTPLGAASKPVTGGFATSGFGTSTSFSGTGFGKSAFGAPGSSFGAKPAPATTEAEKEPEPATSAAQCKHCSSKLDIEEDENWCIECAEWICDDCRDSDPGAHVEADHTLVLYAERENGAVVADVNGGDGDKVIN